jgi:peroxiredoxin
MRLRRAIVLVAIVSLALFVWRSQLFTVSRPGDHPRPLALRAESSRPAAAFDVVLPGVPVGLERLRHDQGVMLVHYWAPWERHGASQAAALDSLRRSGSLEGLRVVLVCFDPFPSVARFVARNRLRLSVLLDARRELREALPCPSVPFTYVIDRSGRIAIAQPGEVEWLSTATRSAIDSLLAEPARTEMHAI